MLSRSCRHGLAAHRALLRRPFTAALRQKSADTPPLQPEPESEDVSIRASDIDIRKNTPNLMLDTIWAGWFSKSPVTMVHIFSVVRYAEKHFGAIRDFRVLRDSEIPTKYIHWIYITFVSKDTQEKFTLDQDFHFRVPIEPHTGRSEAVSLSDVLSLVPPPSGPVTEPSAEWATVAEELLDSDDTSRYLDIVVRRSTIKDPSRVVDATSTMGEVARRYILSPEKYHELASSFLEFKGFHPSSSEPGVNRPMDRCIEKYKHHLGLENSYNWNKGASNARAPLDWSGEGNRRENGEDLDEIHGSKSGPLIQLTREPSGIFKSQND